MIQGIWRSSGTFANLGKCKIDRIAYYIIDETGELVKDIKSRYEPSTSSILVEGLHAGNYRLLVLGIQGNHYKRILTLMAIRQT